MNIHVYPHPEKREAKNMAVVIRKWLEERGHNTLVKDLDNTDLVLVIAGDGFTVHCAGKFSPAGIPVIAINAGDVGFLTQGNINNWEKTLEAVISKKYHVEKRTGLDYEYNGKISLSPVVNDVYLKHTHSIARFKVSVNGEIVYSSLSADGVIVSTPTGSTGYNSSAGGSIIQPGLDCLSITPICQYHFSARPLIVLPETKIEVEVLQIKSPGTLNLMADGQTIGAMAAGEKVVIKKHEQQLLFAVIDHHDFYRALQEKKGLMK